VNICLHSRIAERTYEDRIEVARQFLESTGWNGGLISQKSVRTPVKFRHNHWRTRGFDDPNRLRNHLFPDPIARNHGDALLLWLFLVHGWNVNTLAIIEYRYGSHTFAGKCRSARGGGR